MTFSCRLSLALPIMAIYLWFSNFCALHLVEPHDQSSESLFSNDNTRIQHHELPIAKTTMNEKHRIRLESNSRLRRNEGDENQTTQVSSTNDRSGAMQNNTSNATLVSNALDPPSSNLNTSTDSLTSGTSFPSLTRFPAYGTDEYNTECTWLLPRIYDNNTYNNCTLMAKLFENGREGVSDWANKVVETHQLAVQTNCRLLIQYGARSVDITQIFSPQSEDWRVPTKYSCIEDPTCIQGDKHLSVQSHDLSKMLGQQVLRVPQYRMAYKAQDHVQHFYEHDYKELRNRLPGLHLETSMACSMSSLLRLAPTAALYEPTLFSQILPTLHQDDALVICLYLRTGRTDVLARNETYPEEAVKEHKRRAQSVVKCAERLEQEYLYNSQDNNTEYYNKSVWMIISDAPYLKEFVVNTHSNSHNTNRTILTTTSRGIHTRPRLQPSTQDVAEALIDWYLIGESSLVIQIGSVSFGETGALRTSRPLYTDKCERVKLIHKGERKKKS